MEKIHTKFEMEKFDGSGDFGLWKFKMLMQLELQGLGHILSNEVVSTQRRKMMVVMVTLSLKRRSR